MNPSTLAPHFYALSQALPQAWKNGGGTTRELLAWPPSAQGTNDWQLRVSVADITKDGAFSHFAGVHRAFAVIEGAGVKLQNLDGWQSVTQESEPVNFEGADAPDCKLIDGATTDLNVMWKHGQAAKLTRAYAGESSMSRGFYSLVDCGLWWQGSKPSAPWSAPPTTLFKTGSHIGWWIDFI